MNKIIRLCLLFWLSGQYISAQNLVQQKVVNNKYWRISRNVALTEIGRKLFGQPSTNIQVTYEDGDCPIVRWYFTVLRAA